MRASTRGSVEVLGNILGGEPVVPLSLAAELAVGDERKPSNTLATDTLQAMVYIRGVVRGLDLDWRAA